MLNFKWLIELVSHCTNCTFEQTARKTIMKSDRWLANKMMTRFRIIRSWKHTFAFFFLFVCIVNDCHGVEMTSLYQECRLQIKSNSRTFLLIFYSCYVFHDRITLFFADNFSTECRITMKFLHNFFHTPK